MKISSIDIVKILAQANVPFITKVTFLSFTVKTAKTAFDSVA